jgi:hypothetical protein
MSVNAVGKPSMITITMSVSMVRPRAGSLIVAPPEAALRAASPQGASALGRPGGAHGAPSGVVARIN